MLALALLVLAQQPCTDDARCGDVRLCVREPKEAPTCHAKCALPREPAQRCTVLEPPDNEGKPKHQRRFVWTRDRDERCKTCEQDSDCGLMLDRCVQLINGERACMRDCTWNDECPKDFVCADPAGADGKVKRRQCVPVSGCCHCDTGFTRDEGGTVSGGGSSAASGGAGERPPPAVWQPKPPTPSNWGPPARWVETTPGNTPPAVTPGTSPTPPATVKPKPAATPPAPRPQPQRD